MLPHIYFVNGDEDVIWRGTSMLGDAFPALMFLSCLGSNLLLITFILFLYNLS